MGNAETQHAPRSQAGMLVRKPAAEVFAAFVDPALTTQFWFTKGSGRLAAGRQVQWEWEMYGMTIPVTVKAVEPHSRIVIEWPGEDGHRTVEWTFTARPDGHTFVAISETGFTATGHALVEQVAGSTEGFTLVLAGLKAFLEHGLRLGLVADRFPDGLPHED
jgi:uncharacterized protein YndB with AHSA1/START domain